jgi:hypothetical protein
MVNMAISITRSVIVAIRSVVIISRAIVIAVVGGVGRGSGAEDAGGYADADRGVPAVAGFRR